MLSPQTYTGRDGATAGRRSVTTDEKIHAMWTIVEVVDEMRPHLVLGVPLRSLVFAMWANAWGESAFDATAWRREPDGRVSYGLFQCLVGAQLDDGTYKAGGAGEGHAPASLIDPAYNTRVIAAEAVRVARTRPAPSDVAGLTGWWCRWVERPSDPTGETARRVAWLRSWGAA